MGVSRRRGRGALNALRPAVFFDRDGVLNEPVPDPHTGTLESPLTPAQVVLTESAAAAVRAVKSADLLAIVVTNQPSAAKGRATVGQLVSVHDRVLALLAAGDAAIDASYTCYHHGAGTVPGLAMICACRKPKPGLLFTAADALGLDLRASWMIGDTDADVGAARGARLAGVRIVANPRSAHRRGEVAGTADGTDGDVLTSAQAVLAAMVRGAGA